MGQHVERLGRLQENQVSFPVNIVRNVQMVQRLSTATAIETASAGVQKAARTDGFEGGLGDKIKARLAEIHKDINKFTDYQQQLNKAINLANEALRETATGASGIPDGGLTTAQQNTLDMAAKTDSPVQVSPGVTMTPAQAKQHFQEQAELAQEEAARKLTAALDARLLDIIGALPVSDYDEKPPSSEDENDDGGGGRRPISGPGTGGSGGYTGPGVVNPGTGTGIGNNNTGAGNNTGTGDDGSNSTIIRNPPVPPIIREPHYPEPPTGYPTPYPPEGPNIDGGTGVVPTPGTGGPGSGGFPGSGGGGPGGGITGPGGAGGVAGGVGGVAGGVAGGLAGGVGRLAGAGGLNAAGGINGAGAINAAAGAPGTGVAGVAGAPGGAGRGGMIAAGGHAGAGTGKGGRKNRRRGQDLMAYELEHEDDDVIADLGAAGAAGQSDSDGREELGW